MSGQVNTERFKIVTDIGVRVRQDNGFVAALGRSLNKFVAQDSSFNYYFRAFYNPSSQTFLVKVYEDNETATGLTLVGSSEVGLDSVPSLP